MLIKPTLFQSIKDYRFMIRNLNYLRGPIIFNWIRSYVLIYYCNGIVNDNFTLERHNIRLLQINVDIVNRPYRWKSNRCTASCYKKIFKNVALDANIGFQLLRFTEYKLK